MKHVFFYKQVQTKTCSRKFRGDQSSKKFFKRIKKRKLIYLEGLNHI